jgi:hypothetical protein
MGDVDESGSRFRVKAGKTAAARRWVAVPEWLMMEVADTCPREDRTPDRRVFPGFTPDVAKKSSTRRLGPHLSLARPERALHLEAAGHARPGSAAKGVQEGGSSRSRVASDTEGEGAA